MQIRGSERCHRLDLPTHVQVGSSVGGNVNWERSPNGQVEIFVQLARQIAEDGIESNP